MPPSPKPSNETAVFGGGCFWCTEAVFQRLIGVSEVVSGYSGYPPAEVIKIIFDSSQISYANLLEVFFTVHDPTSLNRQGADVGPQYRSVIFYTTPDQKAAAESSLKTGYVTQILPFNNFQAAEEYHQNFYNSHPQAPYCQQVIDPKIHKLLINFSKLVKN